MNRIARFLLVVLLFCLLVACNFPTVTNQSLSSNQSGDDSTDADDTTEDVSIDYCALPEGTRLTWFDLSTFIFIPESSFSMGFDVPDDEVDYEPAHQVNLAAYWMHETEVTNQQYANCVAAGVCAEPARLPDAAYWYEQPESQDAPVLGVTWEQANAYCQWIGTRLPTEAEWELAARGMSSQTYPWGESAPDCDHANFEGCLEPEPSQPIIASLPLEGISPFEMLGMTGNVSEWVSDWYAADYYLNAPGVNPTGPDTGTQRVFRGGSYLSAGDQLQTYLREALEPDQAEADLGFRCAWSCGEDVPPSLCQYPPVIGAEIPVADPGPGSKPSIDGEGYCEWRGRQQYAGVVLSSEDVNLDQYEFTGGEGVNCAMEGDMLVCTGGDIVPGGSVQLKICPDCKAGYFFNEATGFCQSMLWVHPGIQLLNNLPDVAVALAPIGDDDSEMDDDDGGGSPLGPIQLVTECPPGTYEEDGQCKPDVLEILTGCMPPMVVIDGECMLQLAVECPPLTVEVNGHCIPIEPPPDWSVLGCMLGYKMTEVCGCIPVENVCLKVFDEPLDLGPEVGQAGEPGLKPIDWMPYFPFGQDDFAPDPGFVPEPVDCIETPTLSRRCPAGTFLGEIEGCWQCIPLRQQEEPTCLEGYNYDEDAACCIPEVPIPTCPELTTYDEATHTCIPNVSQGGLDCFEITVKIPACGPRPTNTPEPDLGCIQWTTRAACGDHASDGCKWNANTNQCDGP